MFQSARRLSMTAPMTSSTPVVLLGSPSLPAQNVSPSQDLEKQVADLKQTLSTTKAALRAAQTSAARNLKSHKGLMSKYTVLQREHDSTVEDLDQQVDRVHYLERKEQKWSQLCRDEQRMKEEWRVRYQDAVDECTCAKDYGLCAVAGQLRKRGWALLSVGDPHESDEDRACPVCIEETNPAAILCHQCHQGLCVKCASILGQKRSICPFCRCVNPEWSRLSDVLSFE